MFKAIALIGLGAILALSPWAAVAQTGFGTTQNSHPNSTFMRHWNNNNLSKNRARQSAEWVRRHRTHSNVN